MSHRFGTCLLVGVLAATPLGCEPKPVVVDPGGDGGAVVIEERDVEVEREDPTIPPPDSGTDVRVDVGGGKGIEVDVNRDGAEKTNPNP
jgi:hypothetical protein